VGSSFLRRLATTELGSAADAAEAQTDFAPEFS